MRVAPSTAKVSATALITDGGGDERGADDERHEAGSDGGLTGMVDVALEPQQAEADDHHAEDIEGDADEDREQLEVGGGGFGHLAEADGQRRRRGVRRRDRSGEDCEVGAGLHGGVSLRVVRCRGRGCPASSAGRR